MTSHVIPACCADPVHYLRRRLLSGAYLAVLLLGLFPSHGSTQGRMLTDDQIASASKPATVVILTAWRSTVTFPKATFSPQGMAAIRAYAQEQRQRGVTQQVIMEAILQELARNALHYVVRTQKMVHKEVTALVRGSGFIITPDGYIVTNAHVVRGDHEGQVDSIIVAQGLTDLIQSDLKQFSDALNYELTPDMVQSFWKADEQYYLEYTKLGRVDTTITARIGGAGPFPCDLRKVGQPGGKDIAILKIEQHDLPTVPMGDDTKLRTGSHVVVIGYPGAADFTVRQPFEAPGEPTLTQGDISARRNMPEGWDALQTSAEINHGNSGGPAFNDHGEVIGVATFMPPARLQAKGINFLVPASVATEFLNELNVKPEEGRLSKMYKEGLANFEAHRYKRALAKFQEVNNLNPGFPFVQEYITNAQAEISAGHGGGLAELPLSTMVALIVALAIAVAGGFYFMRQRAAPAAAGPTRGAPPTREETRPQQVASASPHAASGIPERSFGSVQCTAGAAQGRRFPITKQGLLIGRDASKCQVVLPDDAVSKEHAWVVPLEDGVVVIDRGSTNGIYVNSTESPRVNKVRLQHGDRIYIGKGVAVFTYLSS